MNKYDDKYLEYPACLRVNKKKTNDYQSNFRGISFMNVMQKFS